MKTKTWAGLLACLLLICLVLSVWVLMPRQTSGLAEITSGGRVVKTVDLSVDQEFTVAAEGGGVNVITVRGGKIAVTSASCPDHYCMARGYCAGGPQIVCLPNRLIIRFPGPQEIDGRAG